MYHFWFIQKVRNNLIIFDTWCHTGRIIELLQKYGAFSNIDYSEEAIYYSNKKDLKNVVHTDINTWESPRKKPFNKIISIEIFYHKTF